MVALQTDSRADVRAADVPVVGGQVLDRFKDFRTGLSDSGRFRESFLASEIGAGNGAASTSGLGPCAGNGAVRMGGIGPEAPHNMSKAAGEFIVALSKASASAAGPQDVVANALELQEKLQALAPTERAEAARHMGRLGTTIENQVQAALGSTIGGLVMVNKIDPDSIESISKATGEKLLELAQHIYEGEDPKALQEFTELTHFLTKTKAPIDKVKIGEVLAEKGLNLGVLSSVMEKFKSLASEIDRKKGSHLSKTLAESGFVDWIAGK